MGSRYLYIGIIFRVAALIAFSAITTWLIFSEQNIIYIIISILLALWFAYKLIGFLNKVNHKIAYFFNAVENEDSTLFYPEKIQDYSSQELNKSLNKVNKLIQSAKIKNREQEEYFSALLEQIATGIVVINGKGNIMQANTAARKLLNYNTLTHIVQLKRVGEDLYKAFESLRKGSPQQLVNLTNETTTTQLTLRATAFRTRSTTFILISIQDIQSELEAKEAESWVKLIRVLTHEIMNSISPITSLSETLMGYYSNEKEIDNQTINNTIKGLSIIKERGTGLIRFVESYRQLARIPRPTLQSIGIKILMTDIEILLKNESNFNKVSFNIEINPHDLTIAADPTQISQVLINLLKNALQALGQTQNPKIKIIAQYNNEKRCEITIMDNGTGIPKEILDQIFVPFFTTKENGNGIGLSLSRQIMRAHGGSIKVYSKPNTLTKFTLVF